MHFASRLVTREECPEHRIAIYTPEPHASVSRAHCPICYTYPAPGQPGTLDEVQSARRLRVAESLHRSFGPAAWADDEFVRMWQSYQHMTYQRPDLSDDFMAGMLAGVWSLRALKRDGMEEENLKRRVKESATALGRAIDWDKGSGLPPVLGTSTW